jgi:hypothetical protein
MFCRGRPNISMLVSMSKLLVDRSLETDGAYESHQVDRRGYSLCRMPKIEADLAKIVSSLEKSFSPTARY